MKDKAETHETFEKCSSFGVEFVAGEVCSFTSRVTDLRPRATPLRGFVTCGYRIYLRNIIYRKEGGIRSTSPNAFIL